MKEKLVTYMDKWGQNPEILMMRQIFRQMEAGQDDLLEKLEISVLDPRLPRWRQQARVLFEQYWHQYMQTTGKRDEAQAGVVYSHCLVRMMADDGLRLPDDIVSAVEQVTKLIKGDGS
jgi:hypothetical protein